MGTKYAVEHFLKANNWDYQTRAFNITPVSGQIEVHEFDYKGENEIVYEQDGVVVRSWPAIHTGDGPVSYSFEFAGKKIVIGGDTYPNKWFNEYAKDADVAIHECMMAPEDWVDKMSFPVGRALEVATQIHTAPEAFGKIMSTIKPRLAIAFHFFADFNVLPRINDGIRTTYDGPLSLADDLMVWNVTKEEIRVRQVAPIDEAWPMPSPLPTPPMDPKVMKFTSEKVNEGAWPGVVEANQMIYDRINKRYGTKFEPRMK
jgi:ribonuclease Z